MNIQEQPRDATARYETLAAGPSRTDRYVLRLFITGDSWRSRESIATLKRICGKHLAGRHELEIIDLLVQPQRAREHQVFALPTLVKTAPLPLRHVIGNLWSEERVLSVLNLGSGGER